METATDTQAQNNPFILKRSTPIAALNLTVEEYEHPDTGTVHLHLGCENSENVFMVALRTVPQDSTGVAHILEHTVLCGSERYPVRDPFFMMLRRSLNTFMNAFTSSDWTAYPFATQNTKDFSNLLSVYLDAVFFSRLDPLDFAQEGHRVEFEKDEVNGKDTLVFKGVVFNEMKGAMSSTSSILWDKLCYELFPTNTYHFNSGGDPEAIPDLSYQQLRDFYARHYHPSNAIFLTFGDIPAASHQRDFQELVLKRFSRSNESVEVTLEQSFLTPRVAEHDYAVDASEGLAKKTHHVMGWKLGESADLTAMLEAQVLSAVLMENSASPLMHYLETTELGSAPSPLCGVEESMREMVFCCGIEGSSPEVAAQFQQEVLGKLKEVADSGIAEDRLEAILHQIELSQRELTGDGMPYGLNLMLRGLGAAVHGGDPVAALDLDPVLTTIRDRIKDPNYIPGLVRTLLLENNHRVTLTVKPDGDLSAQAQLRESERLAAIDAGMTSDERKNVIDLAEKLRQRQAQVDDPNVLPRVTLADIPALLPEPTCHHNNADNTKSWRYPTGTNGIVYQQWVKPLPSLSATESDQLPLLTGLLTEVGIRNSSYLAVQDRQSATVGSINAATLTRSDRLDEQQCSAYFLLSSKALANRSNAQVGLMEDTLCGARFDEGARVKELVNQIRARRDQSITGSGHSLAMTAATAGMSPLALRSHRQGGLEGIRRLRLLDDSLGNDSALQRLLAELAILHQKISDGSDFQAAVIADPDHLIAAETEARKALIAIPKQQITEPFSADPVREMRRECWVANTQVNFCAKAYATVPSGHPDAPALTVLAAFLRNGFLHRAIREQGGAYGGGASQDGNIGAFRFFSYRDPRLEGTLGDFDQSIRWLLETKHEPAALEEAILGVVGSMDKPGSPAGEAKKHFHETLFNRTAEDRATFRAGIISTTLDDLRRVTETYLADSDAASIAVITNAKLASDNKNLLNDLGLARCELL